jgi:hypothetical protein
VVFLARADGRDLTFGNEGALMEANLVMYDRATGSLWYQLRGTAIAGPLTGTQLARLPAAVARWADWKRRHPTTLVLAGDRASGRFFRVESGGSPPSPRPMDAPSSLVSVRDPRLQERQVVVGFHHQGHDYCFAAESWSRLEGGSRAVQAGSATLTMADRQGWISLRDAAGSELPVVTAYWFAWHAAFPAGVLIELGSNPGPTVPENTVESP